ncbi:MAG TPA: arylsulfotransferase family protein [Thermoanaerobaculia bacterium]|nr:arylsulfotransferase family protein [Thermoanaerobaculia bacterium]
MSRSRPRLLALCLLLAAAGVAWLGLTLWKGHGGETEELADAFPAGSWNPLPGASLDEAIERARLLSLPYLAGRRPAEGGSAGVKRFSPERTASGLRFYTSGHGPEAFLIDLEGKGIKRWRMPYERAFPGVATNWDYAYFRRAVPLPDGGIAALFQGGGVVRLDARSQLVWAWRGATFNDLWPLPGGGFLVLTKEARTVPEIVPGREVLEDSVTELSPEGRPVRSVSLLRALHDSPFREVLEPLSTGADILHANTIQVLDGRCAGRSPLYAEGNWLVSLREIDTVAIVDPVAGRAVWARRGPWRRQHEPTLLSSCRILLFDNRGLDGASRVLEFDPLTGEIAWSWAGESGRPLFSPEAGTAERLANGNTMVVESEAGRAFEIGPEGEVVWEFVSPHRAGRANELVATLFEMRSVPRSEARSEEGEGGGT